MQINVTSNRFINVRLQLTINMLFFSFGLSERTWPLSSGQVNMLLIVLHMAYPHKTVGNMAAMATIAKEVIYQVVH